MAFFGTEPDSGSSNFGSAPDSGSSNFGSAPASGSSNLGAEPQVGHTVWDTGRDAQRDILLFDNHGHSRDGGGEPIEDRDSGDEAANVFREMEALGYEVTRTEEFEAAELAGLLPAPANGLFVLPEAEGGDVFPDGDELFQFVDQGGNLMVFGGSGMGSASASQMAYLNATFGFDLDGRYTSVGSQDRNDADLAGEPDLSVFLDGPESLDRNDGTSYLELDTLPDDATPIYTGDGTTYLANLPVGDGDVLFVGWDYFDSEGQDGGWDATFENAMSYAADDGAPGLVGPEVGEPFFGVG